MSPKASHKVRPGLSSAASLMTTLLISFDQEVLNQHLNLVTPEYPFFESPWLGAKGVFIGRAFLYGLGAGGEAGVTQCLDIIRKELDVTMALCGLRDVTQVSADILVERSWGLNAGTHKQPETLRSRAV